MSLLPISSVELRPPTPPGNLPSVLRRRLDSPGSVLRELARDGTVVLPGAYDAITARLAEASGAKAIYLSGAGVTNSMTACPDIAVITLDEMARHAGYVSDAVSLPVLADADTGFGEVVNVIRTVREYERAGLAGLHIEDQVSPKRCGHLDGKELISKQAMCEKIRAACSARHDPAFLVVARIDARGVNGLDDAIDRAQAYVQAGADAIFPEGLESQDEFRAFREAVPGLLLANMTEFGKTPLISVSEFEALRYNLVIFPMTAFRVMMKAVGEAYETLLREGTQAGILNKMRTRAELYDLIRYPEYMDLDQRLSYETKTGND